MEINLEYEPRAHQYQIHENLKRWNVLVCHRRFGKSVLCINQLIVDCLRCEQTNPRFAYIAPLYKQAKEIAWDYLKEFARPIPGVKFNESELRADFPNGGRIKLYGADNPDALRGIYLDGVVMDEFAQMAPKTWREVIRPALSDRKGYAIFIGTPKGHNAFYDLFNSAKIDDNWYCAMFRASETGIVDEEELKMARSDMTADEFNQEYECSFEAAIEGAVYGEEIKVAREQNRICKVPHDPRLPVICVNDPGDATWAIGFFQIVGREKRWIDSAEFFKPSDEEVASFLNAKPYKYEAVYLPFDATVERRDLGISLVQHFKDLGVQNVKSIPQQKSIDRGIRLVKMIFSDLWIEESMTHAIDCVSEYHYNKSQKTGSFGSKPEHDWSSHTSDMLRYFAVVCDVPKKSEPKPRPIPNTGWQKKLHGRR